MNTDFNLRNSFIICMCKCVYYNFTNCLFWNFRNLFSLSFSNFASPVDAVQNVIIK